MFLIGDCVFDIFERKFQIIIERILNSKTCTWCGIQEVLCMLYIEIADRNQFLTDPMK